MDSNLILKKCQVEDLTVTSHLTVQHPESDLSIEMNAMRHGVYLWAGQVNYNPDLYFATMGCEEYVKGKPVVWVGLTKDKLGKDGSCNATYDICFSLSEDGNPSLQWFDENKKAHIVPIADLFKLLKQHEASNE